MNASHTHHAQALSEIAGYLAWLASENLDNCHSNASAYIAIYGDKATRCIDVADIGQALQEIAS